MTAPLDRARLADVMRGSELSQSAFVAEFRRSVDADIALLLDASGTGDLAQVERLAHRIEGAGNVIGAGPIAQACSVVGRAARSGDSDALRLALDALVARKQALDDCVDALPGGVAWTVAGAQAQLCGGLVFLVVEDHEFQRSLIIRLLRQLGALEVHGFADGASALAAARELRSPAIMVLDLALPQLNGMEVMRIAAQENLALSVIMNSALAQDMLSWPLQTARAYGATVLGAVCKPLTAAKLAPLLAQYRHPAAARSVRGTAILPAAQGRMGVVARWAQETVEGMPANADAPAQEVPAPRPAPEPGPNDL